MRFRLAVPILISAASCESSARWVHDGTKTDLKAGDLIEPGYPSCSGQWKPAASCSPPSSKLTHNVRSPRWQARSAPNYRTTVAGGMNATHNLRT